MQESPGREDKNRKLAEWLGWTVFRSEDGRFDEWVPPEQLHYVIETGKTHSAVRACSKALPDFFRDEAANALLLDKMIEHNASVLGSIEEAWKHTGNRIGYFMAQNGITDRKTAICEAVLALIIKERGV